MAAALASRRSGHYEIYVTAVLSVTTRAMSKRTVSVDTRRGVYQRPDESNSTIRRGAYHAPTVRELPRRCAVPIADHTVRYGLRRL